VISPVPAEYRDKQAQLTASIVSLEEDGLSGKISEILEGPSVQGGNYIYRVMYRFNPWTD